ncbi:MAG TPA: hypothetical protein VEY71_00490 [Chitinophagales bacterium]|nr:hypothetical protein [Chitinophagales bacterium]
MKKLFVLLAIAAMASSACRKAGTGGDAEVTFMVIHHDEHIHGANVYLKFDADEFPGDNVADYDLSDVADHDGHGHFHGLKRGKYFIYAVGFDSAINETVSGGVAFKITKKDEMKSITVPVTEGSH